MCALTHYDIEHREISPFQPSLIIKKRGELIVELQCTPVMTEAVLGERREEKCNKNALPVYLAAITRLVSG